MKNSSSCLSALSALGAGLMLSACPAQRPHTEEDSALDCHKALAQAMSVRRDPYYANNPLLQEQIFLQELSAPAGPDSQICSSERRLLVDDRAEVVAKILKMQMDGVDPKKPSACTELQNILNRLNLMMPLEQSPDGSAGEVMPIVDIYGHETVSALWWEKLNAINLATDENDGLTLDNLCTVEETYKEIGTPHVGVQDSFIANRNSFLADSARLSSEDLRPCDSYDNPSPINAKVNAFAALGDEASKSIDFTDFSICSRGPGGAYMEINIAPFQTPNGHDVNFLVISSQSPWMLIEGNWESAKYATAINEAGTHAMVLDPDQPLQIIGGVPKGSVQDFQVAIASF